MGKDKRNMLTLQQWLNVKGLTTYEKLVYVSLFASADGSSECCPSVAALADLCACSSRQIIRALKSLEEKRLISREAQYLDVVKSQTVNRYVLYFGA